MATRRCASLGSAAHGALPESGADGLVVAGLATQEPVVVDGEGQLGQRPGGGAELGHGAGQRR